MSKSWSVLKKRLRMSPFLLIIVGCLIILSIIPLRLAITFYQVPKPQAILVLGGDYTRMKFTAQFAQTHPNLNIWVSDYPSYFEYNKGFFNNAGIPEERVNYDFCATDTVTNFTCTVSDFMRKNLRHIYLITSDYHLRRAKAIATIVLGSRGIIFTPVSVPSQGKLPESNFKVFRDQVRAFIWLFTGKTGASFKSIVN